MSIQTSANDTYVNRTATSIDYNSPYTAMFWMKITSNPATYQNVFKIGTAFAYSPSKLDDSFGTDSDGVTARSLVADGTTPTAATDGTFTLNAWTHVAIVRVSTTQLKVYINGVDAAMDNTEDVSARAASSAMYLLNSNSFRLYGLQSDVRFFTAALSAAQIQAEMKSPTVVDTTDLWAHIPCKGASVTAALTDDSGNARDFSAVTGTGTITVSSDEPTYGAYVLQERQTFSSTTAASVSLAFSNNVTAGNTIHAIGTAAHSATAPTMTFSDGVNTYTTIGSTYDSADQQGLNHAYAPNIAAGATTVKVTFGASYEYNGLWIREIAQVTASPLDGHNEGTSASSQTSFSISATNANQPALISAVGMTSQTGINTATPGSPMISDVVGFSSQGESSHLRVTVAGANTIPYTSPAADTINIVAAIFDESVSGGNTYNVTLSDAAAAADSLSETAVFQKSLSDAAVASDSFSETAVFQKSISDAANATDLFSTGAVYNLTLADAANASDSLSETAVFNKSVSDAANATDITGQAQSYGVDLVDAAEATDEIAIVYGTLQEEVYKLVNSRLQPVVWWEKNKAVSYGYVFKESPVPGTSVDVDTEVNLTVSAGPPLLTGFSTVPNVVGMTAHDAREALNAVNLTVDEWLWSINSADAGTVLTQSITAGSSVAVGSSVTLTLSLGPSATTSTVDVP